MRVYYDLLTQSGPGLLERKSDAANQPECQPDLDPGDLCSIIEEAVGAAFDIPSALLRRPTRGRANIALARQVAMYLAHVAGTLSLTEVGDLFQRDRTTVAYACQIVEMRRDDPAFDRALEILEGVVGGLAGCGTCSALTVALVTAILVHDCAPGVDANTSKR